MNHQAPTLPERPGGGGRICDNIMLFGRVLRRAGLPAGPGTVLKAVEAVEAVGLSNREDLYWTLHAVFVNRREQREVFDQAFHVFWRNPRLLERVTSLLLPELKGPEEEVSRDAGSARVADALGAQARRQPQTEEPDQIEIDARFTFSETETLQEKDFEQMSADELAEARRALAALALPLRPRLTRRFRPAERGGRIDMRRTLRATLRQGGDIIDLKRRVRGTEDPPLVVICDISGSMGQYTRMFLHFLHALMLGPSRVHVFLFGTRLSNITRQLKARDVDDALDRVGEVVDDWSGGTRIGPSLRAFNQDWSRRVLGQGAYVLLMSDGLERADDGVLAREAERLHRSCKRLIWLNPLLRYDRFEPRASGIKALLPHVDDFRAVHNLDSVAALCDALSGQQADDSASRAA